MNRSIALIPALGALLALTVTVAQASDQAEAPAIKAHVPQTAAARNWADLIARTERALGGYVAACASGEGRGLGRVTTDDLRVDYTLREPGSTLGVDGSSPDGCAAIGGIEARTSNLWIFPTNASVVFIQYDARSADGANPQRRLALVEMRGERISRIVNFAAPPTALVSAALAPSLPAPADDEKVVTISRSMATTFAGRE
jgi:hypothetical protein